MNIILFGPPGVGKGTQSKYLVNKTKGFQISTGDLLRNEMKNQTETGKLITNDMNNGKFVSDKIVNNLIQEIVNDPKKKGKLIFDGYPRSLSQAKYLDELLNDSNQIINYVFFLNVNKDTIIKRIEKRKILEKRLDDELDTILKRYDTYMQTTKPLLNFYSKNPNFYELDGGLEINEITRKIDSFINV